MDPQIQFSIASEELMNKISMLSIGETDDDQLKSSPPSPLLDVKLTDLLWKLPPNVRSVFEELGPLNQTQWNSTSTEQNDGSIFIGTMLNQKKEGMGYQIWITEGNLLEGLWVNDMLEGRARMIYNNGDIFECQFQFGVANGFGVYKSSKKVVKGMWYNNQLNGEGLEYKHNSTKYHGCFRDGIKEGKGVLYTKDGCKYEGYFRNNKYHGSGIFIWNDNSYLVCEYKEGLIMGYGTYFNSNGQYLQGHFQEMCNEDSLQTIQCILYQGQFEQEAMIEKIRVL